MAQYIPPEELQNASITLSDYLREIPESYRQILTSNTDFGSANPETKLEMARSLSEKLSIKSIKASPLNTPAKQRVVFLNYLQNLIRQARTTYVQEKINMHFDGEDFAQKLNTLTEAETETLILGINYLNVESSSNKPILKELLYKHLKGNDLQVNHKDDSWGQRLQLALKTIFKNTLGIELSQEGQVLPLGDGVREWIIEKSKTWSDGVKLSQPTFKPENLRKKFRFDSTDISFEVEENAMEVFKLSHDLHTLSCLAIGGINEGKIGTILTNANVNTVWIKDKAENKLARFSTSIGDDGKISIYPIYWYEPHRLSLPLKKFVEEYSQFLGLDQKLCRREWTKPVSFMGAAEIETYFDQPIEP